MINIAIIGTGEIGSRHLQGLANLNEDAVIQVVDPSEKSLKIATERFNQIRPKKQKKILLNLYPTIDCLQGSLDLALIATNADIRATIIRNLISKIEVKKLLLEKVLFQKETDYFEIQNLLRKKNIPAWVNFFRRETIFYKEVKKKINLLDKIHISVRGSLWEIGCLGTHFIDLLAFLSDQKDFKFENSKLDPKILAAKRTNFKEFTGILEGRNSRGDSLLLESRVHGSEPRILRIENGKTWHKLTEKVGGADYEYFDGKEKDQRDIEIPVQSLRTHLLAKKIIHENNCNLTEFNESVDLHLPLIKVLLNHIQQITGKEIKACPIT